MNDKNQVPKNGPKTYTDYQIFCGKVRVIDSENNSNNVMERDEAIELAKSRGMTLVQISYNKREFPHSICKIIDYGKYLYEQRKNEKKQRKQERLNRVDIKEITFSIRIDTGDKNTKLNHIREFISGGDNVKVIVRLSKREMNLVGMAKDLMKEIQTNLSDIAELETKETFNSGILSCVLKRIK